MEGQHGPGEDCPQLEKMEEGSEEGGECSIGDILGFHILSLEENMIFRRNLTRNFYPASLG